MRHTSVNRARLRRDVIDQRVPAEVAGAVWREKSELADAAGVDASVAVDGERTDGRDRRRFDEPPRRPVEFDDPQLAADVNDAAGVLDHGPVLTAAADLEGAVVADERAAFFWMTAAAPPAGDDVDTAEDAGTDEGAAGARDDWAGR